MIQFYEYWRSSAAYRVRIALALKGVPHKATQVNLITGEQHNPDFRKINPQGLVPAVITEDGKVITQSLAIIDYLEARYPDPPLLPKDPIERAHVLAMALAVVVEVHPLQNLRVWQHVRDAYGQPEERAMDWNRHWIELGMKALEGLVTASPKQGRYCYGDSITLADVILVPMMGNVRRYKASAAGFPRLVEIDARLRELPAFKKAAPENHPAAET